jgi:hypothetical protein
MQQRQPCGIFVSGAGQLGMIGRRIGGDEP